LNFDFLEFFKIINRYGDKTFKYNNPFAWKAAERCKVITSPIALMEA
jgi:hypothetical protein